MTLKVTIEVGASDHYKAQVSTFYYSYTGYRGSYVEYGHSPPKEVLPGNKHEVWISSGQSIRVDELPLNPVTDKKGECCNG